MRLRTESDLEQTLVEFDRQRAERIQVVRCELEKEIVAEPKHKRETRLIAAAAGAIALLLFCVASAVTIKWIGYPLDALATIAALIAYGMAVAEPNTKRDELARELTLLEAEPGEIDKAVGLALSRRGYALVLRSFYAEREGAQITDTTPERNAIAEAYARMVSNGIAGAGEPSDGRSSWTLQNTLIQLLAARLPVVAMGNAGLADSKQPGVSAEWRITLVSDVWWPTFRLLASAAQLTVVFVEKQTKGLSRELKWLDEHQLTFIVVRRRSDGYEHPAILQYDDYATFDEGDFAAAIDAALKTSRQ